MISEDLNSTVLPQFARDNTGLPAGFEIRQVTFGAEAAPESEVWWEFPPPIQRFALAAKRDVAWGDHASDEDLLVLTVPKLEAGTPDRESEILTLLKVWAEKDRTAQQPPSLMMTLQGTLIFWTPRRIAILAQDDRLETVRAALVEATYYERELSAIERSLSEAWPQLEKDMPLAFEFQEASLNKRKHLQQRFQQVLLLRSRLARIAPHVHFPHLHPPTLASQVGERLRERTRMIHRHEFLGEQLEVFENVYENCSERASNYMLTRSGNTLEWVIILLLVAQLIFAGFEILTSAGP